ncbi:hypothetical protein JCM14202_3373 [Agrilactobacillus composti DSM 18527 = JCM 14202]|uniref:hypothetical protein n=1 Tax=Agrilactobacillus composti TaxID=398555 RepID=UPI00042DEE07|nr:hypothetical protein [Agrilactobacillus composti]GAF41434.1 hypothetical protein JCM14202_3373 [Agrilactobacillus composti DSM 18527 = JCM 14202]
MTTEFDQYQANLQQIQTTMLYGQANRIPLLKRILLALDQPDLKYPIIMCAAPMAKAPPV